MINNNAYLFIGGQSLFNWKFYYWFYNNWGTISKEITDSSFGTEVSIWEQLRKKVNNILSS